MQQQEERFGFGSLSRNEIQGKIDLSISIVNWNTEAFLKECIQSIYKGTQKISYEIFVVDNGSRDGSVEMVRTHFPNVHLIANQMNKGFASANNQAVQLSRGRYIIFLNPDTVVHEGALDRMVQCMEEHFEAGVVGCKLLNRDGSIQHSLRKFPDFSTIMIGGTILRRVPFLKQKIKYFKMEEFSFSQVEEVDVTSGAALLVKKAVLNEVGLMDGNYFMFVEDLDLCRRIRAKGYKIYFLPDAVITHFGGESRHQNPNELMIIGLRSLIRYFTKFEGPMKTYLFKLIFKPLFLLGLIYDVVWHFVYFLKYRTIKKDQLKSKKRLMKIKEAFYFFRNDLGYFVFRL